MSGGEVTVKEVTYQGSQYFVHRSEYAHGGTALILCESPHFEFTPESIVLSVYIDGATLEPDEIVIDENNQRGAFQFLVDVGVIEPTGKRKRSGFCVYPVGRLIG